MANKSSVFSIFVLRELFVRFSDINYPQELIPLIMTPIINSRNIIELKTCQVKILKELFGMMSDLISECYLKINQTVLYMSQITSDKNNLFKFRLSNFDIFYCEEFVLYMGINARELNNQLVSIDNTSRSITLCIRNDTRHILRVCSDSKEIEHTLHTVNNSSAGHMCIKRPKFKYAFSMNYEKFDILCEELNKISEFFTIKSTGLQSCDGDPTKQLSFELESLFAFRPYKELCENITVVKKKNFPLIIRIRVGDLGKLSYRIPSMRIIHYHI